MYAIRSYYVFMFSRISNKHVKRISNMEPDKIPFYAFFNKRSYLMMFSMIGLGISLRLTGWIPLEYLSARITSYNVCYTKLLRNQLSLALDDVQDPGNLGTIIRIA